MSKPKAKIKMKEVAKAIKGQTRSNPGMDELSLVNIMDKTWDDLNGLYDNTLESMASMAFSTVELARAATREENLSSIPEEKQKEVGLLMTNYEKDLGALKTALDNIHDLHKDKTGKMKTEQEVIAGVEIIESYRDFSDTITALLLPPSTVLAEIVGAIDQNKVSEEVKELLDDKINGEVKNDK